MSDNRPKLDTLDKRREYLFTQFERLCGDTALCDTFVVPESRLASFIVRSRETYRRIERFDVRPVKKQDFYFISVYYIVKQS